MTYYDEIKSNTENSTGSEQGMDTGSVAMKNQPKLIISSYTVTPNTVEAGGEVTLALTLYNTNAKNSIYNLKISVDDAPESAPAAGGENNSLVSDASVFAPVDSANTFYVAALYPWNTAVKYANMKVHPNAAAGNYLLGVTMDYEDYWGNQYQVKETIGIPVVQKAQVSMGDVKHEELMVGQQTQVSVNIYNTGKDNLNTFMCDVIGKGFTIDNDRRFIGNFNSGSTETFSFNITPDREGPVQGKILLTYEDSAGNVHTQSQDFGAEVMGGFDEMGDDMYMDGEMMTDPETGEMIPADSGMYEDDQGGMGGGIFYSPFFWIGLIVIATLIALLVRKNHKKKKDEELIIDDENI